MSLMLTHQQNPAARGSSQEHQVQRVGMSMIYPNLVSLSLTLFSMSGLK